MAIDPPDIAPGLTDPGLAPLAGGEAGSRRALFGHPPGLTALFMTQMWAEFSYFGLQAMLVYYMTQQLHFDQAKASLIYGAYGGAAFFSPFFGGIIADRWLGRTKSVVLGAVLMMFGHFAMAAEALLLPALVLVALGNGLFLPPLAVQVGGLYGPDDPRRAAAFSAYYMGINLGGLLAPLVCGSLGELLGWHWGFAAAGLGMLVGLTIYLSCRRLLPADPPTAREATRETPRAPRALLSAGERRNLGSLVLVISLVVLFRVGYEQSGNVIALWVADQTDRGVQLLGGRYEVPATWFQSINPLLIILLTPALMGFWARRAQRRGPPDLLARMSVGCAIAALSMVVMVAAAAAHAASGQPVSAWWVIGYFVLLTIGELLVIPTGLALIGARSPVQVAAMMMGAWYIAKFIGSVLAGVMGAYWGAVPATTFFGIGAVAVMSASIGLLGLGRAEARAAAKS
ncbi:peptide MFS transporter [Caulobacter sp.]|uniref:peptide MFS transporter n=1 Tax=Caulobacter sp. TaxID=78 RepID=UPI003BAE92E0